MIEEEDQLPDAPAEETVTEDAPAEASPYAPDPLPAAPAQPTPAATEENPFAQFNSDQPVAQGEENPFAKFNSDKNIQESSTAGTLARKTVLGAIPTATALPAIGYGGVVGAELGAAAGPVGSFLGGVAGGIAGGAVGGAFGSAVQDFALSYVPDDVKKKLGIDDEQAILDENRHPYASQIGGLIPFLVTARPWAAPGGASLATTLTKRVGADLMRRGFSGALMGGWEAANEVYHGDVDPYKVGIATAFGTFFPYQTKYGTKVIESGANAANYTLGKARDLGVFGPGHNEDTFQGDAETNDVAKQASHQYARDEEAETQGPRLPGPEMVTDTARKMEPELFDEYDRLTAIKDEARAAIDEINNGSPKRVNELSKELVQAQSDYNKFVNDRNGYEGGREARVMRQNIRTIQNEIETLSNRPMEHAETEGADNDLTARHRQDLMKADEALRDLSPKLTEAKRRAAIGLNRGDFVIEPKAETPPAEGEQAAAAPDYTADRKAIIKEAKRQMIEAGRPEEEAQAYGEMTASRYVSRADRFQGKLGTPLELYMSEGAKVRSWEPAKKAAAPAAPAAEAPAEVTGEVSFAPEAAPAPAPAPEPAGPKAGDTITLNATRYKIEAIDDNSVKLVAARKKDNALPLNLKRNVFDQMVGEHVAPAAKADGEKITLGGEELDPKLAEVVRNLMAKQEAAPKEMVPGRLPEAPPVPAAPEPLPDFKPTPVKEPQTLLGFIRGQGGLKDWKGELKSQDLHRRYPGLVNNKKGMTLDHAREIAEEAGYLPEGSVPDDLVQALLSDEPVYSSREFDQAQEYHAQQQTKAYEKAVKEARAEVEDAFGEAGFDKQVLDEAAHYVATGEYTPEQAVMQAAEDVASREPFVPSPEAAAFDDDIPFWQQRAKNAERLAGFSTKTREIWLGKNADPSSIIHESGHQYLEELKRDAARGEAPEQIRADMETVKDWVGWKRGQQDFTRKQHEKFAKGFERYIYDGVAPSKELAGVFERFTNWLREVYQSIRGLKRNGIPELTPEIRAVFDRLLAAEPRRTVVAGEIKSSRSLGATHEAEAVKTTHREAAAVADRAAGERAAYVKELPSEVKNELAAAAERNGRSVRELGASADGSGGMAEDRGGQGTRAGSGAGGADRGAQRGGGSENAAEGAGASAGADGNGYVPKERASFASKEGKFVDKAGNIRLENITNEEDLREAAREVAAQNDGFIGDRRGVVTDGQVHDLATAIGDEGAWRMVEKWAKGSAYNAEEIMAMRLLFQKQLARVVELAKVAKASGEGDWQTLRDYAVERDRLVNIQKTVSGATAEWGRAGRSFRDISGSKDYQAVNKLFQENTGRTLFQTRVELDLLSKLDDPEAAANFLRNSDRPGFHRYILEYWINNLISGPVTHATYMVGNDLLAMYRAIPETLARAAVGRAMQAMGRETAGKDLVHFGEALAQVKGFAEGFAPGLKAAAGSVKTGVTTLLPGETMRNLPGLMPGQQFAKPEHMDASYKLSQVIPDMFGAIRGMKEAVIAYGQMLDKGVDGAPLWSLHTSPLGVIPDIAYKGVPAIPIGSAIRVPGRFIQGIHAFHRVNFYLMELNAEAYRRAAAEGLTGEEFAQRVAELKKNPDLEMIKRSADMATEGTMMGQGGEFTRNLAKLTNTKILGVPWLKFIDPFVHITGNVIEQSLGKRTPLALFSPEMRADLSGKNGTYAQDKAVGRIMLGTAVSAAVAGYVMDGMITGGGPKDREERGNWERMGIQPYSVKIGDTWYSYHRLGALGLLIGVAADMYKVAKHASKEEMAEAGAALLEAFSHNILEESFMRGPSELFRAIENPNQYGASWAKNFLSSFAPASVGMSQITRATDLYSRQARTIADAFMGKYPWWSDQLQPRRDLWGEPIANKQLTMGTAIYQSPESRDPVNQEMYRLNVRKAPVEKKIRNIELSPEQYDDYSRIAGRLTKMQLEQVVNSPDYQAMPDFQKMDVFNKVFEVTRKAARETILQKYPQLIHDAVNLKMNRYSDEGLEKH